MERRNLEELIGKETYDKFENIVLLAKDKKITKEEFDLAYKGLYQRATHKLNEEDFDAVQSTLGYIYLNVVRHYES